MWVFSIQEEGHAILGKVHYCNSRVSQARQSFRQAEQRAPPIMETTAGYLMTPVTGWVCNWQGQLSKAIAKSQRPLTYLAGALRLHFNLYFSRNLGGMFGDESTHKA